MKNYLTKYLIADKQVRLFVLKGNQIYQRVRQFYTNEQEAVLLTEALNISALINALNPDRPRTTFIFRSPSKLSKIKTESFANGAITGTIELSLSDSFVNGTLQAIANANAPFGGAHYSYSQLQTGHLYADMQHFYALSEQIPTFFYPVSTLHAHDNMVILLQALPFTPVQTINHFRKIIQQLTVSTNSLTSEEVEQQLLTNMIDVHYLEQIMITYTCHCSKQAFLDVVFNVYAEQIDTLIRSNSQIEIICPLCN
ncbi:Hsp33 family molecular chaperone HslO [Aerococcaceae bacterium NML180378]|nr:Hsp33 family molecular chaperone HslO [Aerococcaceae bacterium NML180378]